MLSKPLPTLNHMPWNVKKFIVNSADDKTKWELRRCSKELNEHVKASKIREMIFFYLQCEQHRVIVFFGARTQTVIEGVDFITASVEHLMKYLRNQALHFHYFHIDFGHDQSEDLYKQYTSQLMSQLEEELSKLTHYISVKHFHMCNDSDPAQFLPILRQLKPHRDLSITIQPSRASLLPLNSDPTAFPCSEIDLSGLAETEQFKKTGSVVLLQSSVPVDCPQTMCIPIMWFNLPTLSLKDVKFIVKNITRRDGWHDRIIECSSVDESVMEYLHNFQVGRENKYQIQGVDCVLCYIHVKDLGETGKEFTFSRDITTIQKRLDKSD